MADTELKARISVIDDVTSPLMDILDSLNIVISAMKNSKMASEGMIDTSSLDAAQASIQKTGASMKEVGDIASMTSKQLKDIPESINNNAPAIKMKNNIKNIGSESIKTKNKIKQMTNAVKDGSPLGLFSNMKAKIAEMGNSILQGGRGLDVFRTILTQLPGPAGALLAKFKALLGTIVALKAIKDFLGWLVQSSDETSNITARLALMNDGMRSNVELQEHIHMKAQETRIAFNELADSTAKFGNNAKAAFKNTEEVVEFASLLAKTYKTAGTEAQGVAAANLQISQALSMGVLRGQELNAVFEHASPVVDLLSKELEVSRGEVKAMGEQGLITAEVLKNALLNNAREINEQFRAMPLTLQDLKTVIKNDIEHAFLPVKAKIAEILNSPAVKAAVESLVNLIYRIADAVLIVAHITSMAIDWIYNHWEYVKPVLLAIGILILSFVIPAFIGLAKVAIAALIPILVALGPIILKIALIAFLIYLIQDACSDAGITAGEVIGFIIGGLGVLGAVIYNVIAFAWNIIISFLQYITNRFVDHVNTVKTGWYDIKSAVRDFALSGAKSLASFLRSGAKGFASFANSAIDSINSIIRKLNSLKFTMPSWLPGIGGKTFSLNIPQISARVSVGSNIGDYMTEALSGIEIEKPDLMEAPQFESGLKEDYINLKETFNDGMEVGKNLVSKGKNMLSNIKGTALDFYNQIPKSGEFGAEDVPDMPEVPSSGGGAGGVPKGAKDALKTAKGTEKNTKDMAKSLGRTNDNLEYLKDKAIRKNISNLKVDINMNVSNKFGDIYQENDLDGFLSDIDDRIVEAVQRGRRRLEI